jgi:hypothetical protein
MAKNEDKRSQGTPGATKRTAIPGESEKAMSWADATIFILCLTLFVVAYMALLKFIALHMEKLRQDIFSTVLSIMSAVSEGMKNGLEKQDNSTNGQMQ